MFVTLRPASDGSRSPDANGRSAPQKLIFCRAIALGLVQPILQWLDCAPWSSFASLRCATSPNARWRPSRAVPLGGVKEQTAESAEPSFSFLAFMLLRVAKSREDHLGGRFLRRPSPVR